MGKEAGDRGTGSGVGGKSRNSALRFFNWQFSYTRKENIELESAHDRPENFPRVFPYSQQLGATLLPPYLF